MGSPAERFREEIQVLKAQARVPATAALWPLRTDALAMAKRLAAALDETREELEPRHRSDLRRALQAQRRVAAIIDTLIRF